MSYFIGGIDPYARSIYNNTLAYPNLTTEKHSKPNKQLFIWYQLMVPVVIPWHASCSWQLYKDAPVVVIHCFNINLPFLLMCEYLAEKRSSIFSHNFQCIQNPNPSVHSNKKEQLFYKVPKWLPHHTHRNQVTAEGITVVLHGSRQADSPYMGLVT